MQVPKSAMGKIVGQGWSTKKMIQDIQEQLGSEFELHTFHGPFNSQVRRKHQNTSGETLQ